MSEISDFVILAHPKSPVFLQILQDHLQAFDSVLVIVPPRTKIPHDIVDTIMCLEMATFYRIPEVDQIEKKTVPTLGHVYDCVLLWETDELLKATISRDITYDIISKISRDEPTVFGFVQSEISATSAGGTDRFTTKSRKQMIGEYLVCFLSQHSEHGEHGEDEKNFLAKQCTEWLKE